MTIARDSVDRATEPLVASLDRLQRERDQLLLLHEALAEVARATTPSDRLRVLTQSIRRLGYGRVQAVDGYQMAPGARVISWISKSAFLDSNDLIVPIRAVDGTTVATLIVGEPSEPGVPPLTRVRTVELFAQQVASIMENASLSDERQRERTRFEERRITEQLVQQEKLAAVGQLVSGVAHELNNPLAAIVAFAQLLRSGPEGVVSDPSALEAIEQESRRAAKIVSNLLTFARQHQPERRITDLNRVVDDTLQLRQYALRIAQIDVEMSLDADVPLTWADPFQLQQVVLNLLINAEQALAEIEGVRRICVATSFCGRQIAIRISDTGPGVAPGDVSQIFNPFFTTKPVGEGTGLGLSISDGIVREHGGRIRVESQDGIGATFVVEIPFVSPPAFDVDANTELRDL